MRIRRVRVKCSPNTATCVTIPSDEGLEGPIRFSNAIGGKARGRAADAAMHGESIHRARPIMKSLGGPLDWRPDMVEPASRQEAAEESAMRPKAAVFDKPGSDDLRRRSPGDGNLADARARDPPRPRWRCGHFAAGRNGHPVPSPPQA